jgi:hypothetical protein
VKFMERLAERGGHGVTSSARTMTPHRYRPARTCTTSPLS